MNLRSLSPLVCLFAAAGTSLQSSPLSHPAKTGLMNNFILDFFCFFFHQGKRKEKIP